MNRVDFQQLAEMHLADAEALLAAGQWPGAYYLLGYVIECALKACICKRFQLHELPDKKLVLEFYTHDLDRLLTSANIEAAFDSQALADLKFKENWILVSEWSEASRYDRTKTEAEARSMHQAVIHTVSGVLTWLRTQW